MGWMLWERLLWKIKSMRKTSIYMNMQIPNMVVFLITLVPSGRKWILNSNNFCLEHFYTLRYDSFLHIFLCSTTYQKLVFYAGIPLQVPFEIFLNTFIHNNWNSRFTKRYRFCTVFIKIRLRKITICEDIFYSLHSSKECETIPYQARWREPEKCSCYS